jgi:hypothetical protein
MEDEPVATATQRKGEEKWQTKLCSLREKGDQEQTW